MVPKLWGVSVFNHEDTIYRILEYIRWKERERNEQAMRSRPVQEPWSRWAVDEIIGELKLDESSYSDEVIRHFIDNMRKYSEVAEPERKQLYNIAKMTAEDLYSFLFGENKGTGKESIPF